METYAAKYYPRYDFDFPISTLFRGALIFLALVVACLLVGKAIEWLRNRRKFDAVAADGAHPKDPEEPSEPGTRQFQTRRQIKFPLTNGVALRA